jgi:hypothetical protein
MQPMTLETSTDAKKVISLVPEAENLLFTSDGRLFVSGHDGLYQVDLDGLAPPRRIPFAFDMNSSPSLKNEAFFLGLAQVGHFVYASCTQSPMDSDSPRYIMFMDITQSPLKLTPILKAENEGIFNGMAADDEGNLYLADSGRIRIPKPGRIMKLKLSSPTTVAELTEWLPSEGARPNGIKIDGDMLYFSEEPLLFLFTIGDSHVKKVQINTDGTAGSPINIFTTTSGKLLDDIELVQDGLLATQSRLLNPHSRKVNKILHISESGERLHESELPLALPSAVTLVPEAGSEPPDLIVTERRGMVSRVSQTWGVKPRRVIH